jgi:hypothetical protein
MTLQIRTEVLPEFTDGNLLQQQPPRPFKCRMRPYGHHIVSAGKSIAYCVRRSWI